MVRSMQSIAGRSGNFKNDTDGAAAAAAGGTRAPSVATTNSFRKGIKKVLVACPYHHPWQR